jgi:DNA repair protein RadC
MYEVIADLPYDDRPRERLFKHGAVTLSDAELTAILLGSGTTGKNAIALGRELLLAGRNELARRDAKQLIAARGVGPAKAARLLAAFELARRLAEQKEQDEEKPLFDTDALGRSLMLRFAPYQQERVGGVFLDGRNRVLHQRVIFAGTIDHALVSTREIIRLALNENAVGIVLYHNHPSGDPTPSANDVLFTTRLRDSLQLCDLSLIDHVIVSTTRYISMRDRGFL